MTEDEAYYSYWARFLDFGYFDHPPVVAWLSSLVSVFPQSELSTRIGVYLLSLLTIPIYYSLLKKINIKTKAQYITATLVYGFSLSGLIYGILLTPDTPLIFFWFVALHEAYEAINKDQRRWLSAGAATGLGIMSKYTMLLIGPVFLLALLKRPKKLLSPWPYLGGVMCLIFMSPHLIWNAQNDFVSFKFQINRGFFSDYDSSALMANQLPNPHKIRNIRRANLNKTKTSPRKKKQQSIFKPIIRASEFLGASLGLYGLFIFSILYALYLAFRRKIVFDDDDQILWMSVLFPLAFFGFISSFQKIEANWAAIYCAGGSLLIAKYLPMKLKVLKWESLFHASLLMILLLHTSFPLQHKAISKDRLMRETHGYGKLAEFVATHKNPIFVDRYQTASLLSFYNPSQKFTQWPGLSRISELIRRKDMVFYNKEDLANIASFAIVKNHGPLIDIEGFTRTKSLIIDDCPKGEMEIYAYKEKIASCEAIHKWNISYYSKL